MITSETWGASAPARLSASAMATLPRSWAGRPANAPLKAPTGVRTAPTMTISSFMNHSFSCPAERRSIAYRLVVTVATGERPGWINHLTACARLSIEGIEYAFCVAGVASGAALSGDPPTKRWLMREKKVYAAGGNGFELMGHGHDVGRAGHDQEICQPAPL